MNQNHSINKDLQNYPGKIPIIINEDTKQLYRILVPENISAGYLSTVLRRKMKLYPSEYLEVSLNGIKLKSNETVSTLYLLYKNVNDNCLHVDIKKIQLYHK